MLIKTKKSLKKKSYTYLKQSDYGTLKTKKDGFEEALIFMSLPEDIRKNIARVANSSQFKSLNLAKDHLANYTNFVFKNQDYIDNNGETVEVDCDIVLKPLSGSLKIIAKYFADLYDEYDPSVLTTIDFKSSTKKTAQKLGAYYVVEIEDTYIDFEGVDCGISALKESDIENIESNQKLKSQLSVLFNKYLSPISSIDKIIHTFAIDGKKFFIKPLQEDAFDNLLSEDSINYNMCSIYCESPIDFNALISSNKSDLIKNLDAYKKTILTNIETFASLANKLSKVFVVYK